MKKTLEKINTGGLLFGSKRLEGFHVFYSYLMYNKPETIAKEMIAIISNFHTLGFKDRVFNFDSLEKAIEEYPTKGADRILFSLD